LTKHARNRFLSLSTQTATAERKDGQAAGGGMTMVRQGWTAPVTSTRAYRSAASTRPATQRGRWLSSSAEQREREPGAGEWGWFCLCFFATEQQLSSFMDEAENTGRGDRPAGDLAVHGDCAWPTQSRGLRGAHLPWETPSGTTSRTLRPGTT
jgi:hypothetical protein